MTAADPKQPVTREEPRRLNTTKTEVVPESLGITSAELLTIKYEPNSLRIQITPEPESFSVYFEVVAGFRMLDERDFTDVWSHADYDPKASVYRVLSGGWLSLEKTRPSFLSDFMGDVTEYLITSGNECVNVLAETDPVFSKANNT